MHLFSLNHRFNLGFEPAIIRSQQPLRLYEWHTVILSRDEKNGNLTIDDKPPVTGISKGSSTGLNLNQDLYVGGVPDYSTISSLSGFKSGFIGCLSFLAVDGKVVNLGKIFECVFPIPLPKNKIPNSCLKGATSRRFRGILFHTILKLVKLNH